MSVSGSILLGWLDSLKMSLLIRRAKCSEVNFNIVSAFTYSLCFQDTFSTLTILVVLQSNRFLSYPLQGISFQSCVTMVKEMRSHCFLNELNQSSGFQPYHYPHISTSRGNWYHQFLDLLGSLWCKSIASQLFLLSWIFSVITTPPNAFQLLKCCYCFASFLCLPLFFLYVGFMPQLPLQWSFCREWWQMCVYNQYL